MMNNIEQMMSILVKGGWVMIPLFLVGFWAWCICMERLIYFILLHLEYKKTIKAHLKMSLDFKNLDVVNHNKGSHFIRGLKTLSLNQHLDSKNIQFKLIEIELQAHLLMNRGLNTLSRIATVAPLIGLVGTVSGMIYTFAAINNTGMVQTDLLSTGISEALIATQAGLITAFPLMLAHHYLSDYAHHIALLHTQTWHRACKTSETKLV